MTLTKAILVDRLFQAFGLSHRETERLVDLFFEELSTTLERGEELKLSGFGNFVLLDKDARPGRNPKTKEPALIEARRVVTFRPGEKLKAHVTQAMQNKTSEGDERQVDE